MHGGPRSSARALAILQGLFVALLVPALALGSFDLHSTALPHTLRPTEVLPGAHHPLAPEHLEVSTTLRIPSCSACLLQLKTGDWTASLPALQPAPAAPETVPGAELDAPRSLLARTLRPRGPPAA